MQSKVSSKPADSVIQHRHAQIQALSKLVRSQDPRDLWKALGQPTIPLIVLSNICTQIVHLVRDDNADLADVLDQLTGFISTIVDDTKKTVPLRAITQLLLFHCATEDSAANFSLHTSRSGIVHPFVTLLRQGHVTPGQIMVEIDYTLSHDVAWAFPDRLFATFRPLFDTILLLTNAIEPSLLINRLAKCVSAPVPETYDDLRSETLQYLLSVVDRYFRDDQYMLLLLLSEATSLFVDCSDLHALLDSTDLQQKATKLLYVIVQTACEAAADDQAVLPYIGLIQQLIFATDLCDSGVPICRFNHEILWISFSILLYSSQSIDDQSILIQLMSSTLPSTSAAVSKVALLPLLQGLTETEDDATAGGKSMKLQILEIVNQIKGITPLEHSARQCVISAIQQEIDKYDINGILLYATTSIVNSSQSEILQTANADSRPRQLTMAISLIRQTSLLFDLSDENPTQQLDEFVRLVTIPSPSSRKFPAFLLLLHVMRQSQRHPEYTNHILQVSMPALVHPNDPLLTSKVLKIATSLIQGRTPKHRGIFQRDSMTSLTSVGIRMLLTIYRKQPRVWQYLKAVVLDWINYRKASSRDYSRRSITVSEHETEMAVLSTVRDVFVEKPLETAQDLLPGIVSLLQTVSDLSVASLALIVHSITACVKADLLDARSIWSIVLSHVASHISSQQPENYASVIIAICKFYNIVGGIKDESEPVAEMRQVILSDYLAVYIKSDVVDIKEAALYSLSCFQATDIMSILEERPKDNIGTMLSNSQVQGYAKPLAKLISYELDYMRRGLFKEGDGARSHQDPSERKNVQQTSSDERQIMQRIESDWKNFTVSPGLRSGFALASLFAYSAVNNTAPSPDDWKRHMAAAFTDINLSDHLLVRLASLAAWQAFFEDAIGSDITAAERQAEAVIDDLLKRLASSKVPGLICNVLMALTGCLLTLHKLSASASTTTATKILEYLFANYFVSKGNKNFSATSLVLNEDVQFAIRFCIGNIAECVINNERMIKTIVDELLQDLRQYKSNISIDSTVELQAFAAGYAIAHLTSVMRAYPTKTEEIDVLSNDGTAQLLQLCAAVRVTDSAMLGIWMGFASRLDPLEMKDVTNSALQVLQGYASGVSTNVQKGNVAGALWVGAYAIAQSPDDVRSEEMELIAQVASMHINDDSQMGHYCVVPFGYMLSQVSSSSAYFKQTLPSLVHLASQQYIMVKASDSSMDSKVSAVLTLSAIIGTDFLNAVSVNDAPNHDLWEAVNSLASQGNYPTRRDILNVLILQIGIGKANLSGNLRAGRIAAFTVGSICRRTILQEQYQDNAAGPSDVELLATSSTEPKSYARLSQATSWLRNVFDALTDTSLALEETTSLSKQNNCNMLMSALQQTMGPLPPVNWFPVLLRLSKVDAATHISCIRFASTHASSSSSLVEFLVVQIRQVAASIGKGQPVDEQVVKLLVSETGLGKIMTLAGLPELSPTSTVEYHRRGVNAVIKKISVSDERCFETVHALISMFSSTSTECQMTVFETLSNHIPDTSDSKLVTELRVLVHRQVLDRLLQVESVQADKLIRYATGCSITNIGQILDIPQLNKITNPYQLHSHLVAICELCRLSRTEGQNQRWITAVLQRVVTMDQDISVTSWATLIQVIELDVEDSELEKYEWLVRMLDVLIVILSSKDVGRYEQARTTIGTCLRSVTEAFWWSVEPSPQIATDIAMGQATYLLGKTVCSASDVGVIQTQLLKRLFKLLEMTEEESEENEMEGLKQVFLRILRKVYISGKGAQDTAYLLTHNSRMAYLTIETQKIANTKPFTFCFYVSGHGWGHATRANQIITDVLRLPAGHKVYVVSNATDFIFQGVIKIGAIYRHSLIDAGVVQPLAYTVDRDETIAQLKTFLDHRPETIAKEVKWLKEVGADCVICDAPFLPCAAAAVAGIPAAIASNFTFDEVYEGLCEGDALDEEIRKLNSQVISDYRNADLLVRLPGAIRIPSFDDSDDLVPITPVTSTFPNRKGVVNGKLSLPTVSVSNVRSYDPLVPERRIIDVPLVFRKFRRPRDEVLAGLNIPKEIRDTHKVLVLSFGGQILGKEGWGDPLPPNWICIVCCASDAAKLPAKFYKATRDAYVPDLTNAADVLLGKLGYGTCSECIGHGTPFVYVPRPQFIEERGLLKLMQNQGSAVELPREDFEEGKWASYIAKAAELPGLCEPERVVGHDGGEVAAKALETFVIDRKRTMARSGDIPRSIDPIVE